LGCFLDSLNLYQCGFEKLEKYCKLADGRRMKKKRRHEGKIKKKLKKNKAKSIKTKKEDAEPNLAKTGAGCVSDFGPAARNELKLRRCGFQQAASKCINSPLYTISEDSYEDVLDFKFADFSVKRRKR
jgi:hypothetical protein